MNDKNVNPQSHIYIMLIRFLLLINLYTISMHFRYIPGQKNNKNNTFLQRLAFAFLFTYFRVQGFLTELNY